MSDLQMNKPGFRHHFPPVTLHVTLPRRNSYLSHLMSDGDKYIQSIASSVMTLTEDCGNSVH